MPASSPPRHAGRSEPRRRNRASVTEPSGFPAIPARPEIAPRLAAIRDSGERRSPEILAIRSRPEVLPEIVDARAGEPTPAAGGPGSLRVYPRMCGGTPSRRRWRTRFRGLSPHVRGNRADPCPAKRILGSIPACAGEPNTTARSIHVCGVYPRMCGGTESGFYGIARDSGLSPHVRGNRDDLAPGVHTRGSIPACAGEPVRSKGRSGMNEVYPRMCGGTCFGANAPRTTRGLSPHVRGNRERARLCGARRGSIPACAGEPTRPSARVSCPGVYPRMCGGTLGPHRAPARVLGLSPHVRGNRFEEVLCRARDGSIPACAGEPRPAASSSSMARVYPRMCGGTSAASRRRHGPSGLSPHVRGNRTLRFARARPNGSIPACAGEPCAMIRSTPPGWVYPRMCGGTNTGFNAAFRDGGLSPHVRGNPRLLYTHHPWPRSIPACAGEPHRSTA